MRNLLYLLIGVLLSFVLAATAPVWAAYPDGGCAVWAGSGWNDVTNTDAAQCAQSYTDGYATQYLLSPTALQQLLDEGVLQTDGSVSTGGVITADDIFAMPSTQQLGQFFLAGFTMPLTFYLVAYGVGQLVAMFNPDPE